MRMAIRARRARRARLRRFILNPIILCFLTVATVVPPAWMLWEHRYGRSAILGRLRAEARAHLGAGRAAAAVDALEAAIVLDAESAKAHRDLGEALLRLGDHRRARSAIERACELDPEALEPRLQLALLSLAERDTRRAREHADWLIHPRRAARMRPFAEQVALLQSQIARLDGDAAEAAEAADRALNFNARSVRAMLVRSDIALFRGDNGRAMKLLAEGAAVFPGEEALWLQLSRAREAAGDLDGAREALGHVGTVTDELRVRRAEVELAAGATEAVRGELDLLTAETDEEIRAYLEGLAGLAEGDAAAAARAFRQALDANALRRRSRLALARALVAGEDYAGARAELQVLLYDDPLFTPARLLLARVAGLERDWGAAAEHAEEILRIGPRHVDGTLLLVIARSRQGQAPRAAEVLERLERDDPSNGVAASGRALAWLATVGEAGVGAAVGEARAGAGPAADATAIRIALDAIAAAHASKRRLVETLEHLGALVETAPPARALALRLELAEGYARLGRIERARDEVVAIAESAPGAPELHLSRAAIAACCGETATVVAEARAFLAARPAVLRGRLILARGLLAAGEAREAFEVASAGLGGGHSGDRRTLLALARVAFAAAAEVDDADGVARAHGIAHAIDAARSPPSLLAAFAVVEGRPEEAARVLDLGADGSPRQAGDPDGRWIAATIALLRGDPATAGAEARASGTTGSVARTAILAHARVLGGDARAALRAVDDGLAPGRSSLADDGLARGLREHVAAASPERVARLAPLVARLLVARAYRFERATAAVAESLVDEAGSDPFVALLVARSFIEAGRHDDALALLRRAAAATRSVAVLDALASLHLDRGEHGAAASVLAHAVAAAPEKPRRRVLSALAHEPHPVGSLAIVAYREDVRADEGGGVGASGHGAAWLLLRHRNEIEALARALRPTIEHRGETGSSAPAGAESRASLDAPEAAGLRRTVLDRVAEVLALLIAARDAVPDEATTRLHLGLAWLELGQLEDAVGELEAAVRLGPSSPGGIAAARAREIALSRRKGPPRPGATFEAARDLAAAEAFAETLGPPDARHLHRVDLETAGVIELRYEGPSDAPTRLALGRREAAGPRELKATPVPSGGELVWRLTLRAGVYTVEASAGGVATVEPYGIRWDRAAAPDPDGAAADRAMGAREPNDGLADADEIAVGTSVRGTLGPLFDRDVYWLPPSDAGTVDIRVRAPGASPMTVALIAPGELGEQVRKTVTVEPSATAVIPTVRVPFARGLAVAISGDAAVGAGYELAVEASRSTAGATGDSGDGAGPVDLFEPDDADELAHRLELGGAGVRGTIEPSGDRDHVRLPAGRSGLRLRAPGDLALRAEVRVTDDGGRLRTVRTIEVAAGGEVRIGSIGGPGLILAIVAAEEGRRSSQAYEIACAAAGETADLEPNDTAPDASTLGAAGPTPGLLDGPTDRDVWRPAGAGRSFRVTVRAIDGPLRASLIAADAGAGGRLERRVLVRPEHPVRIEQWVPAGQPLIELQAAGGATGYELEITPEPYRDGLEAEPNEDETTAGVLDVARPVVGAIDGAEDRDVFTVDLPSEAAAAEVIIEAIEGVAPRVREARDPAEIAAASSRIAEEGAMARLRLAPGATRRYIVIEGSGERTGPTRYRLTLKITP